MPIFLKIKAFKNLIVPSTTIKIAPSPTLNMKKYVHTLILATLLQFSAFSQPYTELSALKFQKYSAEGNEANEYSTAVFIPIETKNSNYVNWEIEYAHKQGKRIVGVWENGELGCELPEALEEYRDAMAGWQGNSIVEAILGDDSIQQNPDGSARGERDITRHPCG